MKKLLSLLLVLILCASLTVLTFAAYENDILIDEADLLTEQEEQRLRSALERIGQEFDAQLCLVTTNFTEGGDVDYYVNHLYDMGGYGYGEEKNGVMLLIAMDLREFRILSNGFASDAIGPGEIVDISDRITSKLTDGDYAEAVEAFAEDCEYYLDGYLNGYPFEAGKALKTALIIGFVISLITVLIMMSQLKSVRKQNQANAYVKPGSLHIAQANDFFLYRNVRRTEKAQSSSSGSRSSGSSRSVGGGRF